MDRVPKAERHHRLLVMLRKRGHTEKELASVLGCSPKTIRRDMADLEGDGFIFTRERGRIRLKSEGLRRRDEEPNHKVNTALRLLHTVVEVKNSPGMDRSALKARLRNVYRDERVSWDSILEDSGATLDEAMTKTLDRDIALLLEGAYLSEVEGKLFAGERLLPVPALSREETIHLYRLVREFGELSPYTSALSSLLGKILATSPHRAAVADSTLLQKRFQRTAVHGRRFNQDWSLMRWREELDLAADRRLKVKVLLAQPGSEKRLQTILPLGLCYNRYNDSWYVYSLPLSQHGYPQALRLDQIRELEVNFGDTFEWPKGFDLEKCVAPSWGISMADRTCVKVRFADVFNVVEKVRREVEHRPDATFKLVDSCWILEDDVGGLTEFRSWLRQFGYAAEVLEPLSLREDFVATAKKTLVRYGVDLESLVKEGSVS